MEHETELFEAGYACHFGGGDPSDCPYRAGSVEREQWLAGFYTAIDDFDAVE